MMSSFCVIHGVIYSYLKIFVSIHRLELSFASTDIAIESVHAKDFIGIVPAKMQFLIMSASLVVTTFMFSGPEPALRK